ncbi:MAG: DUF4345 family protein [Pseudomonadota bacterium]|nr:DUF4345 family protein [Pseudomonadota bacterium]
MWTLMPFGLIYLGLGFWCLAAPEIAAGGIDYLLQSDTARAEFITIYGGLDLGVGLAMLWCGWIPRLRLGALVFSAIFSLCIALTRSATLLAYSTSSLLVQLAVVEWLAAIALGIHALWLWRNEPSEAIDIK